MRTILFALLALGITTCGLAADVSVKVYVNGKLQSYSPPAVMRAGVVYVPLRAGAQSLGVEVKWHADKKMAQVCTDAGCVFIKLSEGIMVRDNLLLPLRKMGATTGARMSWDGAARAVRITR